jgi:hypothetical protein
MIIHKFNHNSVAQTLSIVFTPQHKDRQEQYMVLSNIISVTANSLGLGLSNSDRITTLIEVEISKIANNPPAPVCLEVINTNSIICVRRYFDTSVVDISTINQ